MNVAGKVVQQALIGNASENPSCSGSIEYTQAHGGIKLPETLNFDYVVSE